MEKAIPVGLGLGLVLIFGAIFMGGDYGVFFDIASIALVLGGTLAGLIVAHSFPELKDILAGTKEFMFYSSPNNEETIEQFVDLAGTARREGLLALDRRVREIEDPLIRMGLEMAVDGIDVDEISDMLRVRIGTVMRKLQIIPKFYNTAATFCPAFGMIGTLIGLIQMMQNLTDPSAIGAGMAVAMITTFYGALFANLVFLPFATKAKSQAAEVQLSKELVMAGVLGIVRGDSPTVLSQRLELYLIEKGEGKKGEAAPMAKAA